MSLVLNIETATSVCSVTLSDRGNVIGIRESREANLHSKMLTVFIEELFEDTSQKKADLEAVAVSMGPGSYTGLRIGVSVAKGISYGLGIKLIAVPSLLALANQVMVRKLFGKVPDKEPEGVILCPMIDARRMEVYTAQYKPNLTEIEAVSAQVIDEYSFSDLLSTKHLVFFGNGSAKCKDFITHPNAFFIDQIEASARYMADIAQNKFAQKEFVDSAYFEPFYLKDFIATTPRNKVIPPQ